MQISGKVEIAGRKNSRVLGALRLRSMLSVEGRTRVPSSYHVDGQCDDDPYAGSFGEYLLLRRESACSKGSVCERYFVLARLIVCSILQGGLLPVTHTDHWLFYFQQVCVASVAGSNL
jgi:hypothetical protein